MNEILDNQIATELLARIYQLKESNDFDYKSPMNWKRKDTRGKLTKEILAMANIQDGGRIVIGVEESERNKFSIVGVAKEDIESFKEDDMKRFIRNYADPFVNFDVYLLTDSKNNSIKYVIINVHEFNDIPIICKKDWSEFALHQGRIYTRRDDPPEATTVPNEYFMRDILDLAIRKYARKVFKILPCAQHSDVDSALENKLKQERGTWD